MPAPNVSLTFSAGVAALERIEEARKAREDRMRNALEILEAQTPPAYISAGSFARFVRATAREGLGREPQRYEHDARVILSDVEPSDDAE